MLTTYIRDIKDQPKFEYDKLPESSREKARVAVLSEEYRAIQRDISELRTRSKVNIHALVNSQYHISGLVRQINFVKTLSNVARLEKHILGNLCHFLEDGTYIKYMR